MSEPRELSGFEGGGGEAAGEEVDVKAVADVELLDDNHSGGLREYFGRNSGFRRETYADYHSARPTVLLFTLGLNYPTLFLSWSGSKVYLPRRLAGKVSRSQREG